MQKASDLQALAIQSRRASSLTTVVGCHFPPRAAGILRLDSSLLMARGVVCPAALSSLMVGARLLAYKFAALLFDAAPWPPRLRGAGLGPSTEPIALSSCAHIGSLMPAQRACWLELCDLFQRQPIVCSESGASAEIQSRAVDGKPEYADSMALWDKGTEEVTCRHCGTRHVAVYREYLLSNIGSQGCLNCGKELISWNGARDYIEFRLEKE